MVNPPELGAPVYSDPRSDAPPTYAAHQPQIIVVPLPDSASFFWGRTVQGEVLVKGLGAADGSVAPVSSLTAHLSLCNLYPGKPVLPISTFELQTLYTPTLSTSSSSSDFPSIHRFSIPLPAAAILPGTLDLSSQNRGEVRWNLVITLTLRSGIVLVEKTPIEGTPQAIEMGNPEEEKEEAEEAIVRDGVRCRMVLDTLSPRLGSLLRLGVEVHPAPRRKTAVVDLSSQPDPADTLRKLRRVRVEMFRRVRLPPQDSASTSTRQSETPQHLSLLYASGKSLRYPGSSASHPPLRVLFTLPTTQMGSVADVTWGEITQATPYHTVTFFVRATIGFGGLDAGPTGDGNAWIIEREIEIRPKIWKEPKHIVVSRGAVPASGQGDDFGIMTEEEIQQAYRLKGRDVVGESGTYRESSRASDLPPPFDDTGAGPSTAAGSELPTFLESEAQMKMGAAPLPNNLVPSERLVSVELESEEIRDIVGRRGSLGRELGTWVEYDGYETFSVAPPDVAASYGAVGVMDPPQEGDEDVNVGGGLMGRLGIDGAGGQTGRQLIESLGLGEGSRVVDLHDDLPPGIDEPSLPALPTFRSTYQLQSQVDTGGGQPPPSFAASEAAVAHRRASMSAQSQPVVPRAQAESVARMTDHSGDGDAPPGYFGQGAQNAGPPAYS